jgi:hypothetical protein
MGSNSSNAKMAAGTPNPNVDCQLVSGFVVFPAGNSALTSARSLLASPAQGAAETPLNSVALAGFRT